MSTATPQFLVRGGDGRDYPADLVSLMAWAAERRLLEYQLVFVTSVGAWRRADQIPELRETFIRQRELVGRLRPEHATATPVTGGSDGTPHPQRPIYVAGCVVVVLLSVVVISVFTDSDRSASPRSNPVSPVPSDTRDTATVAPAPIREAALYAAGLNEIAVARTEEAFDRFLKAAARNDRYGYAELAMTGDVFMVPSGTKVLILDYGFAKHRVRILEGTNAGASGWVPREWVRDR